MPIPSYGWIYYILSKGDKASVRREACQPCTELKNFSLILQGEDYRLAPAYDLLNTSLHVNGNDLGLDGGLSPNIIKTDVYTQTGHPCRLDFERFAERIGIVKLRTKKILDKYVSLPEKSLELIDRSFLPDKLKRKYIRIVNERIARFVRESE